MAAYTELFSLAQKYEPLLLPRLKDEEEETFIPQTVSSSLALEFHARLDDDTKLDTMLMQQKSNSILLSNEAKAACHDLTQTAASLNLSHVSFTNIVETLLALQSIDRLSLRVTHDLKKDTKKENIVAELVAGHRQNLESVLVDKKNSVDVIMGDEKESSEQASATTKKTQKYLDEIQKLRNELQAAGVFALCPSETAKEFTSPLGVGPLPHASLKALADRIDTDNKKMRDIHKELNIKYGYPETSFDQTEIEQEIQRLRTECQQLEEQLNDTINNDPEG